MPTLKFESQQGGGGGASEFDELLNRPLYDGEEMSSETNIPNVTAAVEEEAELRAAADGSLATGIQELAEDITAEATIRAAADTALGTRIDNIESRGRYLSSWNATTGLPGTEPENIPYVYKTGDYFIVSTVGTTNYKPNGAQYTGAASTTVETGEINTNDTYLYDGTSWELIHTEIPEIAIDDELSTTSRNPVENRTITSAINDIEETLDEKQDELTAGDNITIEDNVISAVVPEKPCVSLERNSEYLYTVTFDTLPEETTPTNTPAGACSAFVRDGKLYRNLDWYYNNNASFRIVTKDFEGMSFANGLTSTTLDDEKIAQLPYQVTDGVNKHGIMVSTHVLYNDWGWAGTGSTPLTKLPFMVLSRVKSMASIASNLASVLSDLYVPSTMAEAGYLLQVLITDGTTTYVLTPKPDSTDYVLVNATSNPKLTNFKWVSDSTVVRADLQTRPTGVERWNEIDSDTTLEDLRFTKAYEAPTRLSEFIGIDDTDKDSTDAELTAIYDLAHAEYLIRQRDGKLWQTMHSVVYGPNGIERLYVQENWDKDYAFATREYVDEAIEAVEGEIPELLDTTGQSTTAGMTQKAITDALASAGGSGVKVLTEADYNWPVNDPTEVALWLLECGVYTWAKNTGLSIRAYDYGAVSGSNISIVSEKDAVNQGHPRQVYTLGSGGDASSELYDLLKQYTVKEDGARIFEYAVLTNSSLVDGLTSTSTARPLSAKQGKVLKDMIGNLTDLDTTDQSNLVAAINEVASAGGGGVKVLTEDDYNWPTTGTHTSVALWLLDSGVYHAASNITTRVNKGSESSSNSRLYIINKGASSSSIITMPISSSSNAMTRAFTTISGDNDGSGSVYLVQSDVKNLLTSTSTDTPLSANQGKVLKDLIDSLIIKGTGAPTTSTVGTVGKLYEDTTNGKLYQCTAVSGSTYTWTEVGGGGGGGTLYNTVYGTNTDGSPTQAATSAALSYDNTAGNVRIGNTRTSGSGGVLIGALGSVTSTALGPIVIGQNAAMSGTTGNVAIGRNTMVNSLYGNTAVGTNSATGSNVYNGTAIGGYAQANAANSIALGYKAKADAQGQFDISTSDDTTAGYNSTNYRLLTGVHPGINDNDAVVMSQLNAALAQIQALEARIATLEGNA